MLLYFVSCLYSTSIIGTDLLLKNCRVFLPVSLPRDSLSCFTAFLLCYQPVLQQLIEKVAWRPYWPQPSVKHSSLLVAPAGICPLLTALSQWPVLALQRLFATVWERVEVTFDTEVYMQQQKVPATWIQVVIIYYEEMTFWLFIPDTMC